MSAIHRVRRSTPLMTMLSSTMERQMRTEVEGFRLSPQQKLLCQAPHDGQGYITQCALLLEGGLKIKPLKEALRRVIARHEILRTTFRRLSGMKPPVQVIGAKS